MLAPYNTCPVPINQQPRNEYNILRESYLFSLPILPSEAFFYKLLNIWLSTLFFSIPIALLNINFKKDLVLSVLLTINISSVLLVLIFLRIYLGWSYVSKRLLSATILYEESGWYDGAIWIKTPIELVQDRLIAQYTIKPVLKRIQYCTQVFILIIMLSYIWIL
nr:Ycf36 [Tsunamia transpacifica]